MFYVSLGVWKQMQMFGRRATVVGVCVGECLCLLAQHGAVVMLLFDLGTLDAR